MNRPARLALAAVTVPYLTGCFTLQVQPLPEPAARSSAEIRGVVLGDGNGRERVEFDRVDAVEWTDSAVVLTGVPADRAAAAAAVGGSETRSFPLARVTGVLVRQMDVTRVSLFMGGAIVGTVAILALLLTGHAEDYTGTPPAP